MPKSSKGAPLRYQRFLPNGGGLNSFEASGRTSLSNYGRLGQLLFRIGRPSFPGTFDRATGCAIAGGEFGADSSTFLSLLAEPFQQRSRDRGQIDSYE